MSQSDNVGSASLSRLISRESRLSSIVNILLLVGGVATILSVVVYLLPSPTIPPGPPQPPLPGPSQSSSLIQTFRDVMLPVSLASWASLGLMVVWRGRTRSTWLRLGFDQDIFELFVKMRGGTTRLKLLGLLSGPKDRARMAEELGLDWKAVDRQVELLVKYGFVKEASRNGADVFYELAPSGRMLLGLINDMVKGEEGSGAVKADREGDLA